MTIYYGTGLGESTGDSLVTSTNQLYVSGNVYWLNSATGNDSNAGTERLRPLATLAQAVTNADDDDIIVVASTHAESIGSSQAIAKRLTIVGAGSSGGVPTATFTRTFNGVMFNITGVGVQIRGLKFPQSTVSSASDRITAAGARFVMLGCYVECGENDIGPSVALDADYPTVESTTFISVATGSTIPYPALFWDTTRAGVWIRNCIGDGGTVGFKHGSHAGSPVIDGLTGEGAPSWVEGLTLRNGADCFIDTNGGYANVSANGSSQVSI